jgi:chorismate mutase/prephenate dehydrogenase
MDNDRIVELRGDIDELNGELLDLLERRLDLSVQVGEIKQASGLPLYSEERERDLLGRFRTEALERGIDPDYVEELMAVVLVHSRAAQRKTVRRAASPE